MTTPIIESVKPDDREGACNSDMDLDDRESRKNTPCSHKYYRKKIKRKNFLDLQFFCAKLRGGFSDEYQPCWCTCSLLRMSVTLCKHVFAVINSGMATFNDLSPIFDSTHFILLITTYFTIILFMTLTSPVKKYMSQNLPFLEEDAFSARKRAPTTVDGSYFALEREGIGFQES